VRQTVGFFFVWHAPSHRSASVSSFLAKNQVVVLNHPPYSSDMAPCDYFLFPKLKAPMTGCRYDSISSIQTVVTSVLNSITKNDLQKSFYDLDERANRCVASDGMYFELNKKIFNRICSFFYFKKVRLYFLDRL